MIQRCCYQSLFAAFLFLGVPAVGHAVEVTLFSSDFTNHDTGYFEIWEEFSHPDPVLLAWDDSLGSPAPGSLRLEVPDVGQGIALGECEPLDHNAAYTIRADVLPTTEGTSGPACFVNFRFFRTEDCTGSAGQVPTDGSQADLGWQPLAQVAGPISDPQWLSVRAALLTRPAAAGFSGACNFDNLQITVTAPSDIPAIGAGGLSALAATIALLGVFLVATRRGQ